MEELPFLVVHGWWISKLLVVIPPAIGFALLVLIRRRMDRRRAGKAIAEKRARVAPLAEAERGAVLGRYSDDDDGPVVVTADARVKLDGPVRVVRGSRARWTIRMDEPAHAVVDGDEVIASGTASRTDADGPWTLTDCEVVATHPATCSEPMVLTHFFLVSLIGVVTYVALHEVGKSVIGDEHPEYGRRTRRDLSGETLVLAAALPGARDEALDRLGRLLESNFVRSEAVLARRLEIAGLRGEGCLERYRLLENEGRPEDMLEEARRCDYKEGEFRALDLLGRFDDAADIADHAYWLDSQVDILIAAGRWKAAADALAGQAHPSDAILCVSEFLRYQDHDASALGRIECRAAGNQQCKFVLAVARGDVAAAQAFFDTAPKEASYRHRVTRLAWAMGVRINFAHWYAYSELDGSMDYGTGWFASHALAARNTWYAHEALANQYAVRGDFTRARSEVAAAVPLLDPKDDAGGEASARSLDGLLQVRAGISPIVARPPGDFDLSMTEVLAALAGDEAPREYFWSGGNCPGVMNAMRSAMRGDGRPMAALVDECHVYKFDVSVLALLPYVQVGRAELRAAFRAVPSLRFESHLSTWPFEYVDKLSLLRDSARLLGDHERERSLQQVIDRFAAVLSDRAKLFALALVRIDE